jgi:hypothetical protein
MASSSSAGGYKRIHRAVTQVQTLDQLRAEIEAVDRREKEARAASLARSLRAAHDARRGDLVGALLEAGADASALYPGGRCDPLALCIVYKNVSRLKALLKLGHPADRRIEALPSLRSLAGNEGYFCTAAHLCMCPPRLSEDEDRLALPPALDCLKVLLEEGGADAYSKAIEGDALLHDICSLEDTVFDDRNAFDAALDLLLAHGADINARDLDGMTPLMYCAGWGDPAWVLRLLAQGADPDVIGMNGFTALVCACGRGAEDESPAAVLELLRRSSRETRRAVDHPGWSAIDELVYQVVNGDHLPRRLPASTPWKTRAIRQLLLSGVTCHDVHAPIVVPIAAELMALQDVELEQLRSWPETWQGHYQCVSYSFERLDKEAEDARTVELLRQEAELLRLLRERQRRRGRGGGGGRGRGRGRGRARP